MSLQRLQAAMEEVNLLSANMPQIIQLAEYLASDGWSAQQLVKAYLAYGVKFGWSMAELPENLHILKGKVAFQTHALFGLVLSSGKVRSFKTLSSTDKECVIECQRADQKADVKHTIKFTIEMAQKMGLANNQVWQKMPQQMLFARCRSMAVREVFADIISGYDAVELADSMDLSEHERNEIIDSQLESSVSSDRPKATIKAKAIPTPQAIQAQPIEIKPVQAPVQQAPAPKPIEMQPWANVEIIDDLSHAESKALSTALLDEFDHINRLKPNEVHQFFMGDSRDMPLDRNVEFTTEAQRGIIKSYATNCKIDSSGGVMCRVQLV
jgi:hypothetical protein